MMEKGLLCLSQTHTEMLDTALFGHTPGGDGAPLSPRMLPFPEHSPEFPKRALCTKFQSYLCLLMLGGCQERLRLA